MGQRLFTADVRLKVIRQHADDRRSRHQSDTLYDGSDSTPTGDADGDGVDNAADIAHQNSSIKDGRAVFIIRALFIHVTFMCWRTGYQGWGLSHPNVTILSAPSCW